MWGKDNKKLEEFFKKKLGKEKVEKAKEFKT